MFKKFLIIVSCGLIFFSCQQSANSTADVASVMKDSANFTTIKWQDSGIDFGTKKMGEVVSIIFNCTNTGNKPLYLFDVRPGCGCTLVNYTKQAIAPGDQGKIEAKFDTNKSHPGTINKTVYVRSNTLNNTLPHLHFSGTVIAADSSLPKK